MRKFDKETEEARVTLEAVATGLRIVTQSGRTMTLNGEKLPADVSRRITDVTKLEIKDVCQITVTPGGDLDEERFKNMLLILAKAAKNLQVIVLTCHEHDYASSGAQIIRLADCRRSDSIVAKES